MPNDLHLLRRLDTPLAKEYAEWILIEKDLDKSIECFNLWKKYAGNRDEQENSMISTALFCQSVLLFMMCFDGGARHSLRSTQVYPNAYGMSFFNWMKDQRDAYVAHNFGAQRQCVVGVMDAQEHGRGVGYIATVFAGPQIQDADKLLPLMLEAQAAAHQKVHDLHNRMVQSVGTMTPEQIAALQLANVQAGLEQDQTRMSRASFQRVRDGGEPNQRKR